MAPRRHAGAAPSREQGTPTLPVRCQRSIRVYHGRAGTEPLHRLTASSDAVPTHTPYTPVPTSRRATCIRPLIPQCLALLGLAGCADSIGTAPIPAYAPMATVVWNAEARLVVTATPLTSPTATRA